MGLINKHKEEAHQACPKTLGSDSKSLFEARRACYYAAGCMWDGATCYPGCNPNIWNSWDRCPGGQVCSEGKCAAACPDGYGSTGLVCKPLPLSCNDFSEDYCNPNFTALSGVPCEWNKGGWKGG